MDKEINGEYYYISKLIEKNIHNINDLNLKKVSIGIISSFVNRGIEPFLKVIGYQYGYSIQTYFVPYGQYELETISVESSLFKFKPDIIIESFNLNDFIDKYNTGLLNVEDAQKRINTVLDLIENINSNIRSNYKEIPIIMSNFTLPSYSVREYSMSEEVGSMVQAVSEANNIIKRTYKRDNNYYLFDETYFAYLAGYRNIFNEVSYSVSQNPITTNFYEDYANEYVKYLNNIYTRGYKCIAVDADNTLWGGIVGELGPDNIKISKGYPGDIYSEFQLRLKKLKDKGILLILLSKNNLNDIIEVFKANDSMILNLDDFVVIKANWLEKYINLSEAVRELNIGLDSVVFIDDSPFERSMMRKFLPEVTTLEMPTKADKYNSFIKSFSLAEIDNLSKEDKDRNRSYIEECNRKKIKKVATSIEEFYYNLEICCEVSNVTYSELERIEGIVSRTNQFNLTTKRYTYFELKSLLNSNNYRLIYLKYKDRFGDNGIVAFAIIDKMKYEDGYFIDSFMISCRVIGKTVEDFLLNSILKMTINENKKYLYGEYRKTIKNSQVKDFYLNYNFKMIYENLNGQMWKGNVEEIKVKETPWIKESLLKENVLI